MKLYGYTKQDSDLDSATPSELAEITLVASSEELRDIAAFFIKSADGMDEIGSEWEHEHLGDVYERFDGDAHFVVFNPDADGP